MKESIPSYNLASIDASTSKLSIKNNELEISVVGERVSLKVFPHSEVYVVEIKMSETC
jgi:hypothetical protein